MRKFLVVGAVVVICLAIVVVALSRNRSTTPQYAGTVETREIQVGSKIGGRVTEVTVEEGQIVKAGALMVRFECNDLLAQREQAHAGVQQSEATLTRALRGNRPQEVQQAVATAAAAKSAMDEAQNGPRAQEIAEAQAALSADEANAANAQADFNRMQKLVTADEISRMDFDSYKSKRDSTAQNVEASRQRLALLQAGTRQEDIHSAEARYRQAEAAASLSKAGSRPEDIALARDELKASQARLAQVEVSLREAKLMAQADGVVEVVSVRPGDLVAAGHIVITLLEPSQLWVKVYVPETDLAKVHVGQSATVTVDGMQGHPLEAIVRQIASEAEFLPRNVQTPDDRQHQVFGVKVYVDNAGSVLKSGMSATVQLK
jgi:multidrug resistance efflux pump